MGDVRELVLGFLRKHQFTNAEAAFKAELLTREQGDKPLPSHDCLSDTKSESCFNSFQGTADSFDTNENPGISRDSCKTNMMCSTFPQMRTFSPQKQLYMQQEMNKREEEDFDGHEFTFKSSNASPVGETSNSRGPFQMGSQILQRDSSGNDLDALKWVEDEERSSPCMQSGMFREQRSQAVCCTMANEGQTAPWSNMNTELRHPSSSTASDLPNTVSSKVEVEKKLLPSETELKRISVTEVKRSFVNPSSEEDRDEVRAVGYGCLSVKERRPFESCELVRGGKAIPSGPANTNGLVGENNLMSSKPETVTSCSVVNKPTIPLSLANTEEERWIRANWMHIETEKIDDTGTRTPNGAQEYLPWLPPVRLHSLDKNLDIWKEGDLRAENESKSCEPAVVKSLGCTMDASLGWGTSINESLTQEMPPSHKASYQWQQQSYSSGLKRSLSRSSISQGIVEEASEHLSGIATAGDGLSERGYPDAYCNSDTYEDDDDPGYLRQPIKDEEWFLANEINYPVDHERRKSHAHKNGYGAYNESRKLEEDDRSFVEEESYFSGEEYYRSQDIQEDTLDMHHQKQISQEPNSQHVYSSLYPMCNETGTLSLPNDNVFNHQPLESEQVGILRSVSAWEGLISQPEMTRTVGNTINDESYVSARAGGNVIGSDVVGVSNEVHNSLLDGSSEGDGDYLQDQECLFQSSHKSFYLERRLNENMGKTINRQLDGGDEQNMVLEYCTEAWGCTSATQRVINDDDGITAGCKNLELPKCKDIIEGKNYCSKDNGALTFEGFSFPSPSSTGNRATSREGSRKSLWSNRDRAVQGDEFDEYGSSIVGPDDTLAAWRRKSNESSPIVCASDENSPNLLSSHWSISPCEYANVEVRDDNIAEPCLSQAEPEIPAQDEDYSAVQDEVKRLGIDENEYEVFNLKIIHRKNRTGFEEEKDFPVVLNSVIAGRYNVTEYLGSAAFSKAIQAHDLHTGMDVCMKIIKNNKDFFDQSLDEIKLLKFVNKHDPADKYHILRLYDYFYHREHLFIVCELLRANLYEFHKFNRESGGEVYFTMPRLQSIAYQCLEALEFLHKLGIIHCDLKPENILVKSYSRCEIKIIDLGSSCFQTDHLCSYVQSRSYRAPEVILGLPYDQKIDIWSLGCILAELCSGNVLFQNDSLATLLARVVGILGPIDVEVLTWGRDTYKYFTKTHMLYERNQETEHLEYLLPKRTSLHHRLPMGDKGFVEFVGCLLQSNPAKRPSATEALQHPWLSYPYEPVST